MGVDGCVWVQWCTITTKQGKMDTGGGVGMYDLGSRWPGNFPTSCSDVFCNNKKKENE